MNLTDQFLHTVKQENLFTRHHHLLLAVSGGVDSVVLCELCYQTGFTFTIAHCNFQLRGEESGRDELFVKNLGIKFQTSVLVKRFETESYAEQRRVSIQVAARELRYAWFEQLLCESPIPAATDTSTTAAIEASNPKPFDFLLTAHHADDNIETMLMNFFKGTGITGMRGILPKQGKTLRPLLNVHKSSILEFAKEHQLQFVEDSSNASDKYTRNYFRNQLLPAAAKVFPRVEENLAANLHRFREVELLYRQAVDLHKKKLLEVRGNEVHIPVLKLKQVTPLETIVYEIIREYGFSPQQTPEVLGLLDSETGKYVQSEQFRVIRNRNWLIIAPNQSTEAQLILIIQGTTTVAYEQGILEIKKVEADQDAAYAIKGLPDSPNIAHLDAGKITFPLILRKRTQGDYFYPLGMTRKKKLNRFLSDEKASVTQKENTWVLEMNKKIIWIIGRRIDDRFKVGVNTAKLLRISFIPKGS